MPTLHTSAGATFISQLIVSAFLAILFLQSSIDKVVDRRGNLAWLTGHFAKSPLAGFVPALLGILTIMEFCAGILSAVGCLLIFFRQDSAIAFYGAAVAGLVLLALFFGQRMAKEYPGAASLVSYFLLVLAALFLLA
ncbi:MAG TPA: hypothetical protein VGG02_10120 [Chthoniobacterales bacterium]|jgi:hypothetical protein